MKEVTNEHSSLIRLGLSHLLSKSLGDKVMSDKGS